MDAKMLAWLGVGPPQPPATGTGDSMYAPRKFGDSYGNMDDNAVVYENDRRRAALKHLYGTEDENERRRLDRERFIREYREKEGRR
jgi:hypothetical protein